MTLDRWRGTNTFMGWLTLKWDVFMIRRFAGALRRESRRHQR